MDDEILSGIKIREKITFSEEQMRASKKSLYKIVELLSEDKEKWDKEKKVEQMRIQGGEKKLKEKETKGEALKSEFEALTKKRQECEKENEKRQKDLLKQKRNAEEEGGKYLLQINGLEKELSTSQEELRDLLMANKWASVFQEKDLKAFESEGEKKMKEEVKKFSEEFANKIDGLEESLKNIEKYNLKPKQKKLRELQDSSAQIKGECEEMEKKNRELELQIELLKKIPPHS